MMPARRIASWLAVAGVLAVAPWWADSSWALSLLSQMGCMAIVCLSFHLLLGQGGMLSFGHAVFSAAGAFAAIQAMRWSAVAGGLGVPLVAVPLVGGLCGLLLAAVLGYLATRRAGLALAMITLGLGEMVAALAWMLPDWFGGEGGLTADRVYGAAPWGITFGPARQVYYLIAAYALVCAAAFAALACTPFGRLLNAVRDQPERVAFLGYDPRRVRWMAFAIAGGFAGIGGALTAIQVEAVTLGDSAGLARSASILIFTYLGGIGFLWGPVIGAVVLVLSTGLLAGHTGAWQLYVGLVFVAMVIGAPGGAAGAIVQLAGAVRAGRPASWWVARAVPALGGAGALGAAVVLVEWVYGWRFGAGGVPPRGGGLAAAPQWMAGCALLILPVCLAVAVRARPRRPGPPP